MARKLTKSKTAAVEQTFAFKAPAASSVILVGDFTHWQKNPVSLRKHPDGIWRVLAKCYEEGAFRIKAGPGPPLLDEDPTLSSKIWREFGASNQPEQQ